MLIFRGHLFSLLDDPSLVHDSNLTKSYLDCERGALAVDSQNGTIVDIGDSKEIISRYPLAKIIDYADHLILPGFIDTHLHMPQIEMIGSFGSSLLDWLNRFTFPEELKCENKAHALFLAEQLTQKLIHFGTTCAVVFASSHEHSADVLFQIMAKKGLRGIVGKVSMDRHAPEGLLVQVERDLLSHNALIKKWHGYEDRLFYAITPRFAPSCSHELLLELGKIKKEYPDLYVQSHLSETKEELAWVASLFPKHQNYFDVYQFYGLCGHRSLFAHGIYLKEKEIKDLAASKTAIAHCPSSNFFLGSGLCSVKTLKTSGVCVGLGSDVGAGTSLNLWSILGEAYKVSALLGMPLTLLELFYLATLGGARSLCLDHQIGAFKKGYQADFQVVDLKKAGFASDRRIDDRPVFERAASLFFASCDWNFIKDVYVRGKKLTRFAS